MQPRPSSFLYMFRDPTLALPYMWKIQIHVVCPKCQSPEAIIGSTKEEKTVVNCLDCKFYEVHDVRPADIEKAILAKAAERLT